MNTTSSAFFSRAKSMNARQAWALIAAGVFGYEVACKDGQLLSQCVDEWLASRPILTRAAIAALALHLGNAIPERYDVVSLGFRAIRRSSRYLAAPAEHTTWPLGSLTNDAHS
jgi:hypothetical protein